MCVTLEYNIISYNTFLILYENLPSNHDLPVEK